MGFTNATEVWTQTNFQQTCNKCGLAQKCSAWAPKQLQAFGCVEENLQVLFVQPLLTDEDVREKRFMASEANYKVLHDAMLMAGFQDTWVKDFAQFIAPVRCAAFANKSQEAYCRDLLWTGDILRKKPKLIVCLGSEKVKGSTRKVSAYQGLFGFSKTMGRGRVKSLREVIGDTLQLQAVPSPNATVPDATDVVRPVQSAHIEVPDDIYVMNVNSLDALRFDPGLFEYLVHDLKKIKGILDGTYQRKTSFVGRQYKIVETYEEAIQVIDYFGSLETFSYDIETGPHPYALDPYAKGSKILCMAFADSWRRAWVIPWMHKDSKLKDRVPEIADHLKKMIESHKGVRTWNGKFDNRWLLTKHGIKVTSFRDGMLDRGLLDENKEKKLKLWAEMHTDLGYYDEQLQEYFVDEKGKSIPDSKKCYENHPPFEILLQYNLADADVTQVLTLKYEQDLHQQNLLGYSQVFTMQDIESTALTEHAGVAIDWEHREKIASEVNPKLEAVKQQLLSDPMLRKWERDKAAEGLKAGRVFVHEGYVYPDFEASVRGDTPYYSEQHQAGWEQGTVQKLIDSKILRRRNKKLYVPGTKKYELKDIQLNFASPKQLVDFIYGKPYFGLPVTSKTGTGNPSVDEGVLRNNADQHPMLGHLLEYRKLIKWKSTYLDPVCNGVYQTTNSKGKVEEKIGWVRDDGLVHAEFLLTGNDKGQNAKGGKGTVTGRKSCVQPNLQNQKSRGEGAKDIKKYFISKHRDIGGSIMQADYSQLELRVFAVDAKISWMIERYDNDADLHAELACELFDKTNEEVFADGGFWRACAKEFWFGPIYGEGAGGIVDALEKRHKIVWTKEQGQAALDNMYAKMPEFDSYKAGVIADLNTTLSTRTVFGRRRYIPQHVSPEKWLRARALRQAVNFRIQSAGSDMTTYAWIILNRWARKAGIKSRIVISVHDSLIWDVYPGEELIVFAATKIGMENLPFSFVKTSPVKFKTDLEMGPSWGELKGIEKLDQYSGVDLDNLNDSRLEPLRQECAAVIF